MPKVRDITQIIEKYASLSSMLEFDSAGLNFGDERNEVSGILLAQNVTYATLEECKELNCSLLVTHHPAVFGEIDEYTQSVLDRAKEYGVDLYSCHTNLDCSAGGLNDYVANLLGMREVKVIDGCAREGIIDELDLLSFAKKVAYVLDDNNVKIVGDTNKKIKKVALCTGAGARDEELVEYAKKNAIDCIVGGESKLSITLRVVDYSLSLIDVGHYDSEIFCINIFKEWLKDYASLLHISKADVNPYKNIK
ncbi:MAG: Nif3-like dinuclear metal center hexameric protein [Clostridia bacterium]|nr:Nif3-like dinuclear metal center hexameric protein [Clostridia bacterium]MDE7329364.1 Nif3-like dinuclear metal center hexameric protein [Clostridia bacterium]